MVSEEYTLIARKRNWYPEWLWLYTHRLALIYPFRWIMTEKVK